MIQSTQDSISAAIHRSAGYVVRILRGEKAGDLPVEQLAKFELVVNLKTCYPALFAADDRNGVDVLFHPLKGTRSNVHHVHSQIDSL